MIITASHSFMANRQFGTSQAKGSYKATALNDDTRLPICSWYKFRSFWKEKYPKVPVGFGTEDVCTMCHVFHNKMKYKLKEKEDAGRRVRASSSNRDDDNDNINTGDKCNNHTYKDSNDDSDDGIVDDSSDHQVCY